MKNEELVVIGNYILGAIILDPKETMPNLDKLKGMHFVRGYQADLFILLRRMYELGQEISLVTVKDRALDFGTWRMFETKEKMML